MIEIKKDQIIEWIKKQDGGKHHNLFKTLVQEYSLEEKLESKGAAAIIALKQAWFKTEVEAGKGCERCGKTTNLTLDHIVPVLILLQFGVDEKRTFMPENYQLLCRSCNVFKSDRLDFTLPVTKIILQELLNNL